MVDLEELRKKKAMANFRGKSAYCFIRDNKLIKVYANKQDVGFMSLDRDSICDLSKYEADTIVFPDYYLYEDGKKAGEVMDYINDLSIDVAFDDRIELIPLVENYELVIRDILTFSNLKMCDLCDVNILYSQENGFHLIDTTEWELSDEKARWNIKRFNTYVIKTLLEYIDVPINYCRDYCFIDKKFQKKLFKFGKPGERLYQTLDHNLNEKYSIYDLIYAYMTLYHKYYGEELKTLEETKELTKVLKKG